MKVLKVLAVADPAVKVYIDKKYDLLSHFQLPDTTIQFEIIPWEDYFSTMLKAFSGEVSYDVVMIAGHLWLRDFVEQGYLEPLEYDFEDILPVIAREMTYKGQTYLSPSFCDGHMIVYRKSILQKVLGTLPEEVIDTETFLQIVKSLSEAGYHTPLALKAHVSEILLDALPYLRGKGEDIYTLENGEEKCHIIEKAEMLKQYVSLKRYAPEATNQYGNDEIKEAIAKKKVAITTTWSGQMGPVFCECVEPEDLGFATFKTAWNVTWSFAITKSSGKKEQAKKLLAYLRSPEVDQVAGCYSGAPIRKSSYLAGLSQWPWYGVQLRMIEECAKPFISVSQAGVKNDVLYDAIYRAFTDQVSVEDAISEAQECIDTL